MILLIKVKNDLHFRIKKGVMMFIPWLAERQQRVGVSRALARASAAGAQKRRRGRGWTGDERTPELFID